MLVLAFAGPGDKLVEDSAAGGGVATRLLKWVTGTPNEGTPAQPAEGTSVHRVHVIFA